MTSNPVAFILVQHKVGYKRNDVVKWLFGNPRSTSRVLCGELLKEYHHEEQSYNYVLHKDPSVLLTCTDEEVAPLYTQKEFMLMEGIEKRRDRWDAFKEGMLDFGSSLEAGSRVFVTVYNAVYFESRLIRATVHYIGEVQGYQGFQFGVELKDKIEGGHNGTFSGFSYFQCEDGYGKFVPLNRLVMNTDKKYSRQSSSSSQEPEKASSLSMRSQKDSSHTDDFSKNTHSKSNPKDQQSLSTCKIGDRVRFFNKQGQSSEGTVKWIGRSTRIKNFEYVYVGILTDNVLYGTDYENSLPGLGHLISAPKGRGLFIPESMVDKIEQKESRRDMEESVATKPVETMDHPKHEVCDEQQKCLVTIGSVIQLPNTGSGASIYGIVRWIGTMPKVTGLVAGIELEEYMDGCTNGSWDDQNGKSHKFFSCEDGKGLYYPVHRLTLDTRVSRLNITHKNCETTSSSSKATKIKSTDSHVSHFEATIKEKEDTISKLIGEVKHQKEELAKMKQSYEAKLQKNKEKLQKNEEKLREKEEKLQENEEKLKQNEKKLKEKEEKYHEKEKEITGHLQVIATKEKEGKNFQLTIEKQNEKLKAYDNMYDESWIQISQDSVPSWKIDRSVLKCIPQTYLGNGAWGVVHSAEFKGEQVAIKHAHRELLRVQGTVAMVKREISILAHIHHPNLVRFIGAVLDQDVEFKRDVPIIVLELLDMNLRTAYENENLSQATMASIFCDVAYALHYLHEQTTPIIHRDVSAPNILLKKLPNNFYRAKVSDFGSANLAKQSTTAGAGAIIYTAPEMFPQEDLMAEPPEQTVKVDVYSFGIVLLEVVCRKMPVREKRRALSLTCESKWKVIFDLVRQCTRISPRDRPTMREILQYICRI